MRFSRTKLLSGLAFAALAAGVVPMALQGGPNGLGLGPAVAQAQNLGQRAVTGSVVDANSTPIAGATVFLKELKTKAIRSYTTSAKGRFRFAQVNMADDYEIWAEIGGKRSATKTVSSWDARTEFECELKMK
ncbi:MAG: carboxypeptidase-like regulatory domain-containing protein [Terracidiphilus sp.]